MGENSKKYPKVKPIDSLVDRFIQYIQLDDVPSKRKGNVTFNSRDVRCRIYSSELKTLFASNHEDAETKIVYCCSSLINHA